MVRNSIYTGFCLKKSEIEHEEGGWVYDKTRKQFSQILYISKDKQINARNGYIWVYALQFVDQSFTHFLEPKDLNDLYRYVGNNNKVTEVLYGAQLPKVR